MNYLPTLLALPLLGLSLVQANAAPATDPHLEAEQLFVRKIQPMLKAKCITCHGGNEAKIKGGLDLRTREKVEAGGDSATPVVVEGKPADSPLFLAVTRESDDWEPMPPKENDKLTEKQVGYLKDWIAAGAPWPEAARVQELAKMTDKWSAEDGVQVKTSGGLSADWTDRRYKPEDLWAYQPLKKPAVPGVEKKHDTEATKPSADVVTNPPATAPLNPIDAFINARMTAAKIEPAPRADRRTLLRRATYDLTGMPPTPEEIVGFLSDPSADKVAFGKVVDRLLASSKYGEQWGRHWLDVARYADSSGLANDFARGTTWRYRDYVIRAMNEDKPYDQFIHEQLAGDEMAEAHPGPKSSEQMVATGFLRMGPWELTAMEVPKVARQQLLDDVTDVVGEAFLATPLQCARCHDHKFDPIPTRDFYGFQANFATMQIADRPAAFLPEERIDGFEEKKYVLERQQYYFGILKELNAKQFAAAKEWFAEKKLDSKAFDDAVLAQSQSKKESRNAEVGYTEVRTKLIKNGMAEDLLPPKGIGFSPQDYGRERVARKGLERIRWDLDRYQPIAFSVYSGRTPELKTILAPLRVPAGRMTDGELEQTCILTGGDPLANGAKVTPSILSGVSTLGTMDADLSNVPTSITGRRTALADWISSNENPLTARVMANRIWAWHFDEAIAGNPNNFGATGRKPTNPELLDWLAVTFAEGSENPGAEAKPWSIKELNRLIMNSDAYQRSAEHPHAKELTERDPLGTSFAVFKPRRLTAEELRDSMLAVTGELNPVMGGIPARPEMNRAAALQPRQIMGTFAEAWQASPLPEQRNRRSVYALKIRGQLDPFMDVFNSPSPELSCEGRDASTVTPQVFALFNSEATLDRALALATRALHETKSKDETLMRIFQLTFGRAPTAKELTACSAHWEAMTTRHRSLTFAKTELPKEIVRDAVEENTGEKFSFAEPLEVTADFVPDRKFSDANAEERGLAEVCLVLLNTNEFSYIY